MYALISKHMTVIKIFDLEEDAQAWADEQEELDMAYCGMHTTALMILLRRCNYGID